MTRFWHPVADMSAVAAGGELILERGEGVHVWDESGRRYLDATGALWYCNVGYGRTEIADAAAAQMRRLPAYSHYGDVSSRLMGGETHGSGMPDSKGLDVWLARA